MTLVGKFAARGVNLAMPAAEVLSEPGIIVSRDTEHYVGDLCMHLNGISYEYCINKSKRISSVEQ